MSRQEEFTALVLAGQRPGGDPLLQGRNERHKALIPIAGKPMIEHVLIALLNSQAVQRIVVSTDQLDLLDNFSALSGAIQAGTLSVVQSEATPSRSVLAAIEISELRHPLLLTTADHPLLTAELIDQFCREASQEEADLVTGFATASAIESLTPGARRTYWKFRDGAFTGANLFALRTPKAKAAVEFWRFVEMERKKPWRIAKRFGWSYLWRYLLRRYSLKEAIARLTPVLRCKAAALPIADGRAGIDVDKPADILLAEKLMAEASIEG